MEAGQTCTIPGPTMPGPTCKGTISCSKAVVFNWGQFYLQGALWQRSETLLVVAIGLALPASNE